MSGFDADTCYGVGGDGLHSPDLAEARGLSSHLAYLPRAREFPRGMPKSDRKDVIFLGRLWLGSAIFPAAYLAPPLVRGRRELFRS